MREGLFSRPAVPVKTSGLGSKRLHASTCRLGRGPGDELGSPLRGVVLRRLARPSDEHGFTYTARGYRSRGDKDRGYRSLSSQSLSSGSDLTSVCRGLDFTVLCMAAGLMLGLTATVRGCMHAPAEELLGPAGGRRGEVGEVAGVAPLVLAIVVTVLAVVVAPIGGAGGGGGGCAHRGGADTALAAAAAGAALFRNALPAPF